MSFGFWIAFWLLFSAKAMAQSGDGEMDSEPRMTCTSHISLKGSSITCSIAGSSDLEDDEDVVGGIIHNITVCYFSLSAEKEICFENRGNTVESKLLYAQVTCNVTIHLTRGGKVQGLFKLKKIVKPRSPQVWNATFYPRRDKAVIFIKSPYQDDFLKTTNLIFQLHILANNKLNVCNITEKLVIEGEYLQENTVYYVKVRAIPDEHNGFKGTWSEWSPTVNFSTASREKPEETLLYTQMPFYIVIVVFVTLLLATGIWFCRKRIYTLMYPSIPHPKHILKIYKPIIFFPVSFTPEILSDLYIYPVDKVEACSGAEEPVATNGTSQWKESCSSNGCSGETTGNTASNTSINTTESLSTLLSGSSRGEEFPQLRSRASTVSSPAVGEGHRETQADPGTATSVADVSGAVTQQVKEDSYVTMSSFYQLKKGRNDGS